MTGIINKIRSDYIEHLGIDELADINLHIERLLEYLTDKIDKIELESLKQEYTPVLVETVIKSLDSVYRKHLKALEQGEIKETKRFYFRYENYKNPDWLLFERGSIVRHKTELYYFLLPVIFVPYRYEPNQEFNYLMPLTQFKHNRPPLLLEHCDSGRQAIAYIEDVKLWV